MFNALNRIISRLDGESPQQAAARQASLFGFQVLRNANLELAIEPWFDFIIGINGRAIENPDPRLFAQEVRNCAGSSVMFALWNAKGERTRTLHVPVPADTASLGLALQWTPLAVAANIWHVLEVAPNSPADLGGLLPFGDYILGSPDGMLHGESGLSELVDAHIGRPLRLDVYNNEYNVTRHVTIQPTRDWGGEGVLGCMLGYGALHRIPPPLSEPTTAPGETMFDGGIPSAYDPAIGPPAVDGFVPVAASAPGTPSIEINSFIPASSLSPSTPQSFSTPLPMMAPPSGPLETVELPMGGTPAPARRKKDRGHGKKTAMDDYFAEEEKKSRAADNAPSRGATPLPPPPKAGGPPPAPPKVGSPPIPTTAE